MLYLDNAATTPLDPDVAQSLMQSFNQRYANPGQEHCMGRMAQYKIMQAKEIMANLVKCHPYEILWTSGATEANNIAINTIKHLPKKRVICCSIEHPSVLSPCADLENCGKYVTYVDPNENGIITANIIKQYITDDTAAIIVMHVNHVIGTINEIAEISKIARARNIHFHVDGTQAIGKTDVNFRELGCSTYSFSAHKFYGPKGVGGLLYSLNPKVTLTPLFLGGNQQNQMRSGTLPVELIIAVAQAAQTLSEVINEEIQRIESLKKIFVETLVQNIPGISFGFKGPKVPHIIHFTLPNLNEEQYQLLINKVAISRDAACSANNVASTTLLTLGYTEEKALRSLRASFGRFTTFDDIQKALQLLKKACENSFECYK